MPDGKDQPGQPSKGAAAIHGPTGDGPSFIDHVAWGPEQVIGRSRLVVWIQISENVSWDEDRYLGKCFLGRRPFSF